MQFYDLLSQETTSYLIDGRLPYSVQPKTHIDVGNPDSIADYNYDFVFGKGLRTTNEYETVFGKYNSYSDADWQNPKALFVIGNGTSDSSRSNAFEVKEDGTAYAGGKKLLREGEGGGGGGTKLYKHTIGLLSYINTSATPFPVGNLSGTVLVDSIMVRYMKYIVVDINQTNRYKYTVQYFANGAVQSSDVDYTNEVDNVTEL
jgi:hypothetical protein